MRATATLIFVATGCFALASPAMAGVLSFGGYQFSTVGSTDLDTDGSINLQYHGNSLGGGTGTAFIDDQFNIQGNPAFSIFFEFSITNVYAGGADGLVFVMHDSPDGISDVGGGGGFLGYYERPSPYYNDGITNSIAVEFDTFYNGYSFGDPSNNHVALATNANTTALASASPAFDLNNSQRRFAWIDYDGTTLDVSLSTTSVKPGTALISQSMDLASTIGSNSAFIGFTSSTGGSTSKHRIHDLEISLSLAQSSGTVPEPSSSLIFAGMLLGCIRRRSR